MRRQFAWNFAAQGVGLILPPLLIIALARILEPADFGIFALLTIVIAAIQTVTLGPLGEVVVQSKREDIGDFIFTAQLLLGMLLATLLLVLADPLAAFFRKPELAAPLRVSSLLLLINPFVDTAIRISMRKIAFKAVFVRRVVTPLGNAMISIPLALTGWKYWALVWGQIGGFVAAALVVLAMGDWRPRLNFDYRKSMDDLRFSGQMVLQGMVRWVRSQSDKAILGYHISLDALGQYDMTRRLAGIPFAAIVDPVTQVMYSIMSEKVRRGEEIHQLFLLAQRRVLMITLPLCVLLVMNAQGLVTFILGAKWLDISQMFMLLVMVGALSSLVGGNTEVFKAKGKPKMMTQFMLVRAAFTVPVFLLLAPNGIYSLALGALGLACIFGPINVYLTLRLLGVCIIDYLRQVLLRPILVAGGVAAANLALLRLPLEQLACTLLNVGVSGGIVLATILYWERDLFRRRRS